MFLLELGPQTNVSDLVKFCLKSSSRPFSSSSLVLLEPALHSENPAPFPNKRRAILDDDR